MKGAILVLLGLILLSCQTYSNKIDPKALKNEVFDIHDEVMPKMGDLRRVRKALLLQADSLLKVDSTRASVLKSAADSIAVANDGMMEWMRNFNPDFEGTDEEVINYLNEQKRSITKVRDDMLGTLESGQQLLEGQ